MRDNKTLCALLAGFAACVGVVICLSAKPAEDAGVGRYTIIPANWEMLDGVDKPGSVIQRKGVLLLDTASGATWSLFEDMVPGAEGKPQWRAAWLPIAR